MKVIPLTRGKYTIVDNDDYNRLMKHSWAWVPATGSRNSKGYAVRKGSRKKVSHVPFRRIGKSCTRQVT